MLASGKIQGLARAIYQYMEQEILPQLGWQEFERLFTDGWRNRYGAPVTYLDVFPLLAYQAAGGEPDDAIPLAAAWVQFMLSGRIFDDVFDNEGSVGVWHPNGVKQAVAMGLFTVGSANMTLAQLTNREAIVDITEAFNRTLALAARWEAADVVKTPPTLEHYYQTVVAKTGMVFATGAWSAARLAINEPADLRLQTLYECGLQTGMLVQVLDDCTDIAIDLVRGQWTLPVLHGLEQRKHPHYTKLKALLNQADMDEGNSLTIVDILRQMGSIEWSLGIAAVYQQQALATLADIPEIDKELLVSYVKREFIVE
jgi:geranylgeranyl pyrophosphate synthase